MRIKKRDWNRYMAGAVGEKGYYIKKIYGPFRTKEIAEFFNFIAFVSPRLPDAKARAKDHISYLQDLEKPIHPKYMFRGNARFNLWWESTYGVPFTSNTILLLANECRANGYESFTGWLVNGSKLDGMAPHHQYFSTLT